MTPAPAEDCSTPADDDCDGSTLSVGHCLCIPGVDTQACYTGAQGTLGVGPCVGGTATCNPDGTSFGSCIGEVVPQPEICATAVDEDCDGLVFDDIGDGCLCDPAKPIPCYEGPAGTLGVGVCVGENYSCAADGMSYGACNGQQLPAAHDDCTNQLDDDCDGSACAATEWAHLYGDSALQAAPSVAWDPQGNLFAAGSFAGSIDFGDGPHISTGDDDIYVVKLDPTGKVLWSKSFGNVDSQMLRAIATEPSGDLLVAFETASNIPSNGDFPSFIIGVVVVRFKGATGTSGGAVSLGGANMASAYGLARSAQGVYLVGGYSDGMFASAKIGGSPQGWDAYVLRLDPSTLLPIYGKRFGDGLSQEALAVATDPIGNVVVGGRFAGALTGISAAASAGSTDAFVARFPWDLSATTWVRTYGDVADQSISTVATNAAGDVFLGGQFGGAINFGGATLQSLGSYDAFAAKLDGAGGHVWSKAFGGTGLDQVTDLEVGPSGEVVMTGLFTSNISVGNLTLPSAGGLDAFLVKLDASGSAAWAKGFGDAADQWGWSVAVRSTGDIALGSTVAGKADFGLGTLTSAGSNDAGIAVFNP